MPTPSCFRICSRRKEHGEQHQVHSLSPQLLHRVITFPEWSPLFSGARFGAGGLLDSTWEGVQGPPGARSGGKKLIRLATI